MIVNDNVSVKKKNNSCSACNFPKEIPLNLPRS